MFPGRVGGAGGWSPRVDWLVAHPGVGHILVLPAASAYTSELFSTLSRHQLLLSCCSLCPRPRVAQFQGAGTGCQMATAPRLAAHYTPLPREVSRQGRGLCSVGQYKGEVGLTLALLSRTSLQIIALREDYLKLVFPKTQSSETVALYLAFW